MRISDWSSDVCSSDLLVLSGEYRVLPEAEAASAARAINVALSVREHAQLFAPADAPIVEIMCPCPVCRSDVAGIVPCMAVIQRSEEHTSELQSLMRISYAVFCLKKKKQKQINKH